MSSHFQKNRIFSMGRLTALLALLACPLAGGWAQTMEMDGGISAIGSTGYVKADKKVYGYDNRTADGFIEVGSAHSAHMAPSLRGISEDDYTGTMFWNFPQSTSKSSYYTAAFYFQPKTRTSGLLTQGNLFRIDNYTTHRMSLTYDGQLRLGGGVVPSSPTDLRTFSAASIYVDGATTDAYLNAAGTWCVISTRDAKMNIKGLSPEDAWVQLEQMNPVEYEYRQKKIMIRLKDGREILYRDAMAQAENLARSRVKEGEEMLPLAEQEALAEIVSGEPYRVWTDEPSGVKTQGFIAEDLPDGIAAADHKSYAPALVTVANTAALKEAKRRITELEAKVEKLESDKTKAGADGVTGVSAATLTQTEVEAVADRALVELGLLVEVEVAADDAWVQVDETAAESRVETVTRYRLNAETRSVEPYTAQETVSVPVPTGRKVWQLKEGVRLDETTGKFLRLMLAPTAPASETEGLAKLLAPALRARFAAVQREQPTGQTVRRLRDGVRFDDTTGKFLRLTVASTAPASESEGLAKLLAPALRARFAAALRASGAPAASRTVSMNLK